VYSWWLPFQFALSALYDLVTHKGRDWISCGGLPRQVGQGGSVFVKAIIFACSLCGTHFSLARLALLC
jgi:hypothetical protein